MRKTAMLYCWLFIGLLGIFKAEAQMGQIIFMTSRGGNQEIVLINEDGSNEVNLTNHPASDRSGVWSPDGEKIAFISDRDGTFEIYTMNADGSDPNKLTTGGTDGLINIRHLANGTDDHGSWCIDFFSVRILLCHGHRVFASRDIDAKVACKVTHSFHGLIKPCILTTIFCWPHPVRT